MDSWWVEEKKMEQGPVPNTTQGKFEGEKAPEVRAAWINVRTSLQSWDKSYWVGVTSKKTGFKVYLPLPIRQIVQLPDSQGGGCIIRGYYGDESTTKESIVEIMDMIGALPVNGASTWSIAE